MGQPGEDVSLQEYVVPFDFTATDDGVKTTQNDLPGDEVGKDTKKKDSKSRYRGEQDACVLLAQPLILQPVFYCTH